MKPERTRALIDPWSSWLLIGLNFGGDRESKAAAMNQGYDQAMREESVDWTKLMRLMPRRKPDVQGMTLDGETVLLDLSTGRSYRLNAVGTVVWEQCDGSATLLDIQAVLRLRCELPPKRAHDEVVSVVLQLGHEGFLSQGRMRYGSAA